MATDPSLIFSAQVTGLEESVRRSWAQAQRGIRRAPLDISIKDNASLPLGRISDKASEFDRSLRAATDRVLGFGIAAGVFFQVQSAVQSLFRSIVDVEQSLARINVNLGQSAEGLQRFSKEIFNIAKESGQTFENAAKAAEELARQGLGAEQTTLRLRDALILSRLASIDSVTAVENLTAAVNSYAKEALSTSDVINRLVAVDTSFAVSTKDLSDALSRVGSSAAEAGVEFNELLAIVTAVQQTTARGGAVIGNSFKTIFTRIQRPEVLKQLEELGVAVKDIGGNSLPAIQILTNLANTYDTLSSAQRSIISEQVAGVFQINILKAALGDLGKEYSIYGRALDVANGATDEAIRKNEELNKTLASLLNETAQGFVQLFAAIGDSGGGQFFKNLIGVVNDVLGFLNGTDAEQAGETFGSNIVKGITNVLTGPAFYATFLILFKAITQVGVQAAKALTSITNANNAAASRARIQQSINGLLGQATQAEREQFLAARSIAQQKEVILGIQTRITNETLRQVAAQRALQNAFVSPASGLRGALGGTTTPLRRVSNAAGGYVPPVANEMAAIKRGVGGAKPSAKPVVIPNFAFGGGKRGTVVANSNEYIVPNFAGGGSAIFNPDMIKSMGLPSGAKKINAAGGYVPNFAKNTGLFRGLSSFGGELSLERVKKSRFDFDPEERNLSTFDSFIRYVGGSRVASTSPGLIPFSRNIRIAKDYANFAYDRKAKLTPLQEDFFSANKLFTDKNPITRALVSTKIKENRIYKDPDKLEKLFNRLGPNNFLKAISGRVGIDSRLIEKYYNNKITKNQGQLKPREEEIFYALQNYAREEEVTFFDKIPKNSKFFNVGGGPAYRDDPNTIANGYIPNFANIELLRKGLATNIGKGRFGTAYKLKNKNIVTKEFERGDGDLVDDFVATRFLSEDRSDSAIKFLGPIGTLKRSRQRGYLAKPFTKDVDRIPYKSGLGDIIEYGAGDIIQSRLGIPSDVHTQNFGLNDKASKFVNNITRSQSVVSDRASQIEKTLGKIAFNPRRRNKFLERLGKQGINFEVFDPLTNYSGVRRTVSSRSSDISEELRKAGIFIPNFANPNLIRRGKAGFKGEGAFGKAYELLGKDIVTKVPKSVNLAKFGFAANPANDIINDFLFSKVLGSLPQRPGIEFPKPLGNLQRSIQRGYTGKPLVQNAGEISSANRTIDAGLQRIVQREAFGIVQSIIPPRSTAFPDINDGNYGFNDRAKQILGNIRRNEFTSNNRRITNTLSDVGSDPARRAKFLDRFAKAGGKFQIFDPIANRGTRGVDDLFRNFPEFFSSRDINFAKGYVPNFTNPLFKAIEREQQAGVRKSDIYVDRDSRVRSPMNPLGLLVANKIDEPQSGSQGVNRAIRQGINPKFAGAANGFVPNFVDEQGLFTGQDRLRVRRGGRENFATKLDIDATNAALQLLRDGYRQGNKAIQKQAIELFKTIPFTIKSRKQAEVIFGAQNQFIKEEKAALAEKRKRDDAAAKEQAKLAQEQENDRRIREGIRKEQIKSTQNQNLSRGRVINRAQREARAGNPRRLIDLERASAFVPKEEKERQAQNVAASNAQLAKLNAQNVSGPSAVAPSILAAAQKSLNKLRSQDRFDSARDSLSRGQPISKEDLTKLRKATEASVLATKQFKGLTREDISKNQTLNDLFGREVDKQLQPIESGNFALREQRARDFLSRKRDARLASADEVLDKRRFSSFRSSKSNEEFLRSRGIIKTDADREVVRGTLDRREDRRQQRIQSAALGAAFIAPFVAGLIPQGEGGTNRGIGLGATSGALQGAGFGAILGPKGAILGAAGGALLGAFSKLTKSAEEISAGFDKLNAQASSNTEAIGRYVQIQEQLNQATESGASPVIIERLNKALIDASSGLDKDLRQKLTEAGTDLNKLGDIAQTTAQAQIKLAKETNIGVNVARLGNTTSSRVETSLGTAVEDRSRVNFGNVFKTLIGAQRGTDLKNAEITAKEIAQIIPQELAKSFDPKTFAQISQRAAESNVVSTEDLKTLQSAIDKLRSSNPTVFEGIPNAAASNLQELSFTFSKLSTESDKYKKSEIDRAAAIAESTKKLVEQSKAIRNAGAFLNFDREGAGFSNLGRSRDKSLVGTTGFQTNKDRSFLDFINKSGELGSLNLDSLSPELANQKKVSEARVSQENALLGGIDLIRGFSQFNTATLTNRNGDPIQKNIVTILERLAKSSDTQVAIAAKTQLEIIKIKDNGAAALNATVKPPTVSSGGIVAGVSYSTYAGGLPESAKRGIIERTPAKEGSTGAPSEIGPEAEAARKKRQEEARASMNLTPEQRKKIAEQSLNRLNIPKGGNGILDIQKQKPEFRGYLGQASPEKFAADKARAELYFNSTGGDFGSKTNLKNFKVDPFPQQTTFERNTQNLPKEGENTEFGTFISKLDEVKNTFANTKLQAENTIKVDLVISPETLQLASKENLDMISQMFQAKMNELQTQLSSLSSQVNRNAGNPLPPTPSAPVVSSSPAAPTSNQRPQQRPLIDTNSNGAQQLNLSELVRRFTKNY